MSVDIYQGKQPFEIPLYSYADAARYLHIPASTIKSWVKGRRYKSVFYAPLIEAMGDERLPLSFHNLVELHVLSGLRTQHNIKSKDIRKALDNAKHKLGKARVLLSEDLHTFGPDMFIEDLGQIVNLTRGNQIVLKDILKNYLKRVERDDAKIPIKFYPIVQGLGESESPVSIDPRVSFGRPVVRDSGVNTKVIAQRIDAGESLEDVAQDYGFTTELITDVLYYEKAA